MKKTVMSVVLMCSVSSLLACTPPLECGPGTHAEGRTCVVDMSGQADGGTPMRTDAGTEDAGLIDAGTPRRDGGISVRDWSSMRGTPIPARKVGTFDMGAGSGQIVRVLPSGIIIADGTDCLGVRGGCTLRWLSDDGTVLATYSGATIPTFSSGASPVAYFLKDMINLGCTSVFIKNPGIAVAVDANTGALLQTLSTSAVDFEWTFERTWVRVALRPMTTNPCDSSVFSMKTPWLLSAPPRTAMPPAVQEATVQANGLVNDGTWILQELDAGISTGNSVLFDPQTQVTTSLPIPGIANGEASTELPTVVGRYVVSGGTPATVTLFQKGNPSPLFSLPTPTGMAGVRRLNRFWVETLWAGSGSNRFTVNFHDVDGQIPLRSVESSTATWSNGFPLKIGPTQFVVSSIAHPTATLFDLASNATVDLGVAPPFKFEEDLTGGALFQADTTTDLMWLSELQASSLGIKANGVTVAEREDGTYPSGKHAREAAIIRRTGIDADSYDLFDASQEQRTTLTQKNCGQCGGYLDWTAAPGWMAPSWILSTADALLGFSERETVNGVDTVRYLVVPWNASTPPRVLASFPYVADNRGRAARSADGSRVAVAFGPVHAMEVWVGSVQ